MRRPEPRPAPGRATANVLDDAAVGGLLAAALADRSGPVRLIGAHLHDLAVRLAGDAVPIELIVPGRRDARAYRRALRQAGTTAAAPVTADIRVDLPIEAATMDAVVCRLDPRTFPFPRHTVRELGRTLAPGGLIVLLAGVDVPWPSGLVDAWTASAGLVPRIRRRADVALPFAGAVYVTPV
jgi:SAM-dependent methyltransferase